MVTILRARWLPPARRVVVDSTSLIVGCKSWLARVQQRHALAGLDDRMLADVGLSRADQEAECNKPFWRR